MQFLIQFHGFLVKMCRSLIIFVALINFVCAKIAPNYIVPCPGLNSDCLKRTAQEVIPQLVKGIPNIGIEVLDPLKQNNVELVLPGGLKIHFTNGTVRGLRECIVDSVKYESLSAEINLHCDINISGMYKATGRILLFSINGDGDAHINTKNITVKAKLKYEDHVRNGIVYRDVKKIKFDYKYGGRVTFNITNLIKGSPDLSNAVLSFLNENWRDVTEEFGKPIVEEIMGIIIKNLKKFFSSIPKNELIIDQA